MEENKELTLVRLASRLCKAEGKKHQASIGDVREILKLLCDMIAAEVVVDGKPDVDSEIEYLIWEEARIRADKIRKKLKSA